MRIRDDTITALLHFYDTAGAALRTEICAENASVPPAPCAGGKTLENLTVESLAPEWNRCANGKSAGREPANETATLAWLTRNLEFRIVPAQYVLHYREAQPYSTILACTPRINPKKALRESRQMLGIDALAAVFNHEHATSRGRLPAQLNATVCRRVPDRIR